MAIAKGEYKPKLDDPKIWFESLQSMSQVLSNENRDLLSIIVDKKPQSLKDLEALSGRKSSNLSRTLKTMERYGIIGLVKGRKEVVPVVNVTSFKVEFDLIHRPKFP
jgi:predicted transcriptional regulator